VPFPARYAHTHAEVAQAVSDSSQRPVRQLHFVREAAVFPPSVIESPMLGTTTSSTARSVALKCKFLLDTRQLGCADANVAGCSDTRACCTAWHWPICHARSRVQAATSLEADRNDILTTSMGMLVFCLELCCSYIKVTTQHHKLPDRTAVQPTQFPPIWSITDSMNYTCKCRNGVAACSRSFVLHLQFRGRLALVVGRRFTSVSDVALQCHLLSVRHFPTTSSVRASSVEACIAPVEAAQAYSCT
jgi:hypothetical protein